MNFNKKDIIKISIGASVLLALLIMWLGFGERGFIHLYQMEQERLSYIQRIQDLERENDALLDEIDKLRNDKHYIESLARRELGLVHKDETIYRFSKDDENQGPSKE